MARRVASISDLHQDVKVSTISRYLPANYKAILVGDTIFVVGVDNAGWTLDDYVIPRLASGLYHAHEVHVPEEVDRVFAVRESEDTFAVEDEVTGELLDEVVTTEQCENCGSCNDLVHNPDTGSYHCIDCDYEYVVFITIAERTVFQ